MAERRFSQWRNLGLAAPVIFAASRVRRPSPVQLASECRLRGFAVAGVATGSLMRFLAVLPALQRLRPVSC